MTGLVTYPAVFIAGICLGIAIGAKVQHHKLTREITMQRRDVSRWLDRTNEFLSRRLTIIIVVILAVSGYAVVNGNRTGHADTAGRQRIVMCLTEYGNRLHDALQPRQAASEALQQADEAFNDALVNLLHTALSPASTDGQRHEAALELSAAARHKQQVADHLSAERKQNPYPEPPKKVCPQ